jgi:hypothetical protein
LGTLLQPGPYRLHESTALRPSFVMCSCLRLVCRHVQNCLDNHKKAYECSDEEAEEEQADEEMAEGGRAADEEAKTVQPLSPSTCLVAFCTMLSR